MWPVFPPGRSLKPRTSHSEQSKNQVDDLPVLDVSTLHKPSFPSLRETGFKKSVMTNPRPIEDRCKKRKEAPVIDWELAARKQELLSVLPERSAHEKAYNNWRRANRLQRPWARLSYTERAEWSRFYFNMETQDLYCEDDEEWQDEDAKEYAEYVDMHTAQFIPYKPKPESEPKRKVKKQKLMKDGPDGSKKVIGTVDHKKDKELNDWAANKVHEGLDSGKAPKAEKVTVYKDMIDPELRHKRTYNQFGAQKPVSIYAGNQPTAPTPTGSMASPYLGPMNGAAGTYQSPYAGKYQYSASSGTF